MAVEYRYINNIDVVGRQLFGVVVDYDDTAVIGGQFRERIERGALQIKDVVLNLSHDRQRPIARQGSNLDLIDKNNALEMRASIPKTRDGDDALTLIKAGVLRGLSVEMSIRKDEWRAGGRLRLIKEAVLSGIGVVDKPAYPKSSVEARQAVLDSGSVKDLSGGFYAIELRNKNNRISGMIPYNSEAIVSMRYGERQIIRPGAFTNIGDGVSDIYLLAGYDYAAALASTGSGSLEIEDRRDGLYFTMTKGMPKATYARDFRAKVKSGLVAGVVPGFVPEDTELVDGVKVIKKAMLCEVNLVARSSAGGRINQSKNRVNRLRRGI